MLPPLTFLPASMFLYRSCPERKDGPCESHMLSLKAYSLNQISQATLQFHRLLTRVFNMAHNQEKGCATKEPQESDTQAKALQEGDDMSSEQVSRSSHDRRNPTHNNSATPRSEHTMRAPQIKASQTTADSLLYHQSFAIGSIVTRLSNMVPLSSHQMVQVALSPRC